MAVVGCILFIIIGLFCGVFLVAGSTGFWLWFFALGSEIVTLFFVSAFSEGIDSDSAASKVMNVIGTSFWGIGISLLFSDGDGSMGLALFCVICLFIAPYLIVASLDALFEDSVGAMVVFGIAKAASSVLLYNSGITSIENTSAEIPLKFIAYVAIILLLVLLFWIITVLKKIGVSNEKRREQRIREEEQRKLSCSEKLIFDAGKSDRDAVLNLLKQGADVNYEDSDGQTPLSNAVLYGNVGIVSLLLEKGADIEQKSKDEFTPLGNAILRGNKEIVSLLLEKGVNIEYESKNGITPLQQAVMGRDKEIVSLLLEKGANIEHEDENGFTPLVQAVSGENKEMISFLLEKGANIEHESTKGITPLQQAVMGGIIGKNKEIISLLLENGANVNRVSKDGTTPLSMARVLKSEEIVSFLIKKGADVNLTIMNSGFTVLQAAIGDKDKKMVSLLLDAGAEINRNSNEIETVLQDAVDKACYEPEIVSLLIERGADVNLESSYNGLTPLAFAVEQDNKDAVLLLLKNGADPNKECSKADSPLTVAFLAANKEMCALLMENGANPNKVLCMSAMMQSTEVAQFFLDRGADVNCKGFDGKTPLHCAILTGYKEMALFLISHGADVNLEMSKPSKQEAARTPLEAAIVTGNTEMVSLLITYGADVNYKTQNGNTPLLFAALHQKTELVPLLKEAGAVSPVSGKDAQSPATTSHVGSDLQDDSADFNAALVALSKIIAKNGAEILSAENSQKLKAFVSDLIPLGNETAAKLKQTLPCGFAQIILSSDGQGDSQKEKAFKESVDKIVAETELGKETAISIVKLVALSLDWNLEGLDLQ